MKIENLSLGEIVTNKPEAAAIFEAYSLDFCCRGKQKLSEALTDPGKLSAVVGALEMIYSEEKNGSEIDFKSMPLSQLVDYILNVHHKYVKESIPLIRMHLDKVVTKHGEKYPQMQKIQILFNKAATELETHMMKEELILFPRIKAMESTVKAGDPFIHIAVESPIKMMEKEHVIAGDLLAEIKKLSNNYTPAQDACTTHRVCIEELKMFENDLHKHVHLENNILFPKAIKKEHLLVKN